MYGLRQLSCQHAPFQCFQHRFDSILYFIDVYSDSHLKISLLNHFILPDPPHQALVLYIQFVFHVPNFCPMQGELNENNSNALLLK